MPDIIHCDCGSPMIDTGECFCCLGCGAEESYAVVAVRVKAAALAVQMSGWLVAPIDELTPLDPDYPGHGPSSDLVEWCRSARDVLEAVGRG